ncbi:MAG: TetR/AcrR family transcriptional regulator [Spirochaetia bacterium]|nr:TetR/AcrR family transcriptional regulator [Spirochaetia bacterium]
MPRTKKQFEEIRNRSQKMLLSASLELFAEKGFHSTTMDDIARGAGVSKGLAYNYFTSKTEILSKILEDRFSQIQLALKDKEGCSEPLDRLEEIIVRRLTHLKENPLFYRLYYALFLNRPTEKILQKLIAKTAAVSGELTKEMDHLFSQLGANNSEMEAVCFFSELQGVAIEFAISPKTFPLDDIQKTLIEKYRRLYGNNKTRDK